MLSTFCFSTAHSHLYNKVCPFGEAKQDHVKLGEMAPLRSDRPLEMKFTGGESCWNGPGRSITVRLECGADHVLSEVMEPSRCEYSAVLSTPAACDDAQVDALKEELQFLEEEAAADHDEF